MRIGLKYMVSLEHDFENVVLLQHARVDILYLMVGMQQDGMLLDFATKEQLASDLTFVLCLSHERVVF